MENLSVTPWDREFFSGQARGKEKKKKSVTVKCDSRRDWRIRWKPIPGSQTKCTKLNAIIIIIIIITFPRSDLEFSTILYFGVRFILGLWKLAETCVSLRASQETSEFWTLGLGIGILGGFRFWLVLVCFGLWVRFVRPPRQPLSGRIPSQSPAETWNFFSWDWKQRTMDRVTLLKRQDWKVIPHMDDPSIVNIGFSFPLDYNATLLLLVISRRRLQMLKLFLVNKTVLDFSSVAKKCSFQTLTLGCQAGCSPPNDDPSVCDGGGKPPHGSSSPNLDKTGGLVWASFYGSFCQRQRTRKEWKCYLFWLKISASKENWNYFQQVLFCKKKGLLKIWCGLSVCYCRDFFPSEEG